MAPAAGTTSLAEAQKWEVCCDGGVSRPAVIAEPRASLASCTLNRPWGVCPPLLSAKVISGAGSRWHCRQTLFPPRLKVDWPAL